MSNQISPKNLSWYTDHVPITERFLHIFSIIHFFTIFCAIKIKRKQGKFLTFDFN